MAAREWWGTNYKGFVDMGLSGFWNDMNEPSIRNEISGTMPLDTVHRIDGTGFAPRTATHREAHNIFGAQNARGTYEGVLKLNPNERPYVMTRAAFAGAQRYSVTWTGDNSATWNHLRMTTSMLENLGLSGYAFAGADVGGHIGSPSPELLTKWLEIASFQPIERDHASKASLQQEPWVNGPEMEAKARKFIELRYRLMPYIYTMAEETSRTGLPMIRPLFMEFPTATRDLHPIDLDAPGEFMWGADLLIAEPTLLEFRSAYSPKLPGDLWYDFWTGAKYAQPHAAEEAAGPNRALAMESKSERKKINGVGAGIHLQANLDDVPVYVRGGAIIPMQAVVQDTEEKPQGPLELRVYPGDNCGGSLYIDDGHTFNYRNGEYLRVQYACTVSDGGVSVSIGKREGGYAPWWTQVEVVVFGAQAGWKASVNGSELAGNYDAAMHAMHVIVPESTAGSTINFRSK